MSDQIIGIITGFVLAVSTSVFQSVVAKAYKRREYIQHLDFVLSSALKDIQVVEGSFSQFEQLLKEINNNEDAMRPIGYSNHEIETISSDIPLLFSGKRGREFISQLLELYYDIKQANIFSVEMYNTMMYTKDRLIDGKINNKQALVNYKHEHNYASKYLKISIPLLESRHINLLSNIRCMHSKTFCAYVFEKTLFNVNDEEITIEKEKIKKKLKNLNYVKEI